MSIDNSNNRAVGYKVVSYKPENGFPPIGTPLNFGTKRIPIKASSKNTDIIDIQDSKSPSAKQESNSSNEKESDTGKLVDDAKSLSAEKTQSLTSIDESQLSSEGLPEVSFVTNSFSRDFILEQDKQPAISKTYYFHFDGETFPGVVTNSEGRLFLYDRAGKFHRPLKTLTRRGDPHSHFHAGFLEEKAGKKNSHNYVDLGNIEVLQAALQSSRDGKYAVNISQNDSFLKNWMLATSSDNDEKSLYWLDNMVKLKSKGLQAFISYGLPIAAFLAPFAALVATGVSLDKQIDIRDDVAEIKNQGGNPDYISSINNQSDNFDDFKLSLNDKNQVIAHFDDGSISVIDKDILSADEAKKLGITNKQQTTISVDDKTKILINRAESKINNQTNLLTTKEINDVNNAYDVKKFYEAPQYDNFKLSLDDKNQVIAHFDNKGSSVVDKDILSADEAKKLGIGNKQQTMISVDDKGKILINGTFNDTNNQTNLLTTREVNDINTHYDVEQYLESRKDKPKGISENGNIALAVLLSLTTAGGAGYAYASLKNRAKYLKASSREANIQQKPEGHDDTLTETR